MVFIQDFPSTEQASSFEGIQEELKMVLKLIKDGENMSLINKALFGGWIAVAKMAYNRDKLIKGASLPRRFDYWMNKKFKLEKQTIYDYIHLYKLVSIAPKLLNCQVSMSYFVKNYVVFMAYFKSSQTAWIHKYDCACDDCSSYFF